MRRSFLFALLGLVSPFAMATRSQNCTWDTITPSQSLVWCPCYDGFFCAKLDVPLDYQNPNLGRASVPLIKLPANSNSSYGAYQGMILINPGGPGDSAVDEVQNNGVAYYQSVTGDNWDIVGFEPRGIYRSEPNINCSATSNATQNLTLNSRFVPEVTDDFFTSYIEAGIDLGQRCEEVVGGEEDAGPHMSTTTNARDMISIVDAFAKTTDGKRAAKPTNLLNYFGYSYGTFLGQVFASMFPERVGNMVLDGVLSLDLPLGEDLADLTSPADGIIASFFIYCFEAGLSQCSFYSGSSPLDMYSRFNESFIQLDSQRAKTENWANATDIEAALLTLKTTLYYSVASPASTFSSLSDALVTLEQAIAIQNVALWTEQVVTLIGDPTPAGDANAELRLGTLCTDQGNKWYNKTLEDLTPAIEHLKEVSIVGEIVAKSMLGCLGWSIEATEVFSGPFGGDTATPILFVGNTYDPISPATEAVAAAKKYKNAQAVTVDATGHTSRVTGNACQQMKVNTYFQNAQLPGNDSFCALETGPFGIVLNGTLEDIINQAGLSQLDQ
ncbi:TAP-like protein-domain-containing protein [Xylaria sp. FL1042]|nr:TAP-like protein-domain-containing protein [Xylaria sp. FL1042]